MDVDASLFSRSPFPGKDRQHLYNQALLRYQGYLKEELPISYELIEQKTALQKLQNFLLSSAVYLIIFCAIYFSSDVLVRDRRNQSILQGLPLSWYRLLNIKTLVTFPIFKTSDRSNKEAEEFIIDDVTKGEEITVP